MTPRGMGVSGEYVDRHKLIDLLEEDKLLRNDIFEAEELYEALRKYTKSLNIYFIKEHKVLNHQNIRYKDNHLQHFLTLLS